MMDEVILAMLKHESAEPLAAALGDDLRSHEAEAVVELARQPAIELGRLPRSRTPRMVAQSKTANRGFLSIDGDAAGGAHVLLVVSFGEDHLRIRAAVLAAVHRAQPFIVEL